MESESCRILSYCIQCTDDISAGPVARAHLPQRVPFGFHGNWVSGVKTLEDGNLNHVCRQDLHEAIISSKTRPFGVLARGGVSGWLLQYMQEEVR